MTQRHLSPKEILSYLCDLERKLPKREFKIYIPTHHVDNTEISAEELNAECQKMLVFAGLKNYLADAKFAVLDNSIAGNTIPGDTSGGAIHINVSIDMKRNWRGVLATLAHEICHHVIHYHGIRPNLSWMLETYTDLCTMYIGFGELILQGYRTNMESGTLTLGYLDRNTYAVTNHLVSVVCGGVDSHNTGLAGSDLFADDAIEVWEGEHDKNHLLLKVFKEQSAEMAELQRNINLVEQLTAAYREEMKTRMQELDKSFFAESVGIDGNMLKLVAFKCIYEANIDKEVESAFSMKIENYGKTVESVLYQLYMNLKENRHVVFNNDFVCPVCGKHYKSRSANEGTKVIKCSSCGTHFAITTDHWNLTRQQRNEEIRRIAHEKEVQAEFEYAVAEKKVAFEHDMKIQRENLEKEKISIAKEFAESNFPSWLKRLTKRYFITH